jgi:hypothetical protein
MRTEIHPICCLWYWSMTRLREVLCRSPAETGWWLSRKWRGGFQTQIAELKGTNRNTVPRREKILARIQGELDSVYQYLDDLKDGLRRHPGEGVSYYIAKAEALIELLEIHDCGSVGGFDPESGGDSLHGLLYLEERFEALKRKYALNRRS